MVLALVLWSGSQVSISHLFLSRVYFTDLFSASGHVHHSDDTNYLVLRGIMARC